jgi:hypothetical protein
MFLQEGLDRVLRAKVFLPVGQITWRCGSEIQRGVTRRYRAGCFVATGPRYGTGIGGRSTDDTRDSTCG